MLARHAVGRTIPAAARGLHNVAVLPSGKAVVSFGTPGRSGVTGHVATVFGASSFLGRYLVAKIAKVGTQVVLPYRDEYSVRHLRPCGDLGQIVPLEFDIRNEEQIAECVRHSDIVYNLIGENFETKNFKFDDVHVIGAQTIARICAENSVPRFVHVSHLNADVDSPSAFYRSKARGEEAVKAVFPEAIIIRPGPMYGQEDKLLNNMAFWPILWNFNGGQTKIRPVWVQDVAQAMANITQNTKIQSTTTFNLPGPVTFNHAEMQKLISLFTFRPVSGAPEVPKRFAVFLSKLSQRIWWPSLSPDEIERRFIDDVMVDAAQDWAALGVNPIEVEKIATSILRRYRSGSNYVRPVVLPGEGRTTARSQYHVAE